MKVDELKFNISEDIKALIPGERLASIIQTFTEIDSNQDGKVEVDEFLDFSLTAEKIRLTKEFEALDLDRDGCITFEEYVRAKEPSFSILKKFRELDLDHDGLLSIEEAINIVDQLVLPISTMQLLDTIAEVDRDGDGQITYYEFLGAITHIGFQ
jgi:Ca2+-binding EF-hand superfamily protein